MIRSNRSVPLLLVVLMLVPWARALPDDVCMTSSTAKLRVDLPPQWALDCNPCIPLIKCFRDSDVMLDVKWCSCEENGNLPDCCTVGVSINGSHPKPVGECSGTCPGSGTCLVNFGAGAATAACNSGP